MERILIDDRMKAHAEMYETAFRAYGYDVPGDLRALKGKLAELNIHNRLAPDVLAQYQGGGDC